MSSLPKETLELIAAWAEILTVVLALASACCGIVLVVANRPLKEIEAQDNEVLRGTVAEQQTRAATAERELLELQERIKPRILTDQQCADFVAVLKKLPNTALRLGWTAGGGDESFKLLQQLMPLFKQAQWRTAETTNQVSNHLDIQVTGIALLIPGPEGADSKKPEPNAVIVIQLNPEQTTLQAAFRSVGMELKFERSPHTQDGVPELVIGSKPNP